MRLFKYNVFNKFNLGMENMRKFLIFLVSLVVLVCVGLTTFYFVRNNEIITLKTNEIYCNAGDAISLNSLGIKIEKANKSKKTTFNYNAGGEDVEKYIKYDATSNAYIVSLENAGEVKLVIGTSNPKYPQLIVNVHIGNGSVENPYYIFNETDLARIGNTYRLDKHYVLMNDITLTSNFQPIGFNSATNSWEGFSGSLNGNGYTIKALNLSGEYENAGLFSSLNATASVKNLTLTDAMINGDYKNAGVVAGTSAGTIEKVVVKNSTIINTSSDSFNGAIAGVASNDVKMSYADNVNFEILGTEENSLSNVVVGGLFGKVQESTIQATYTNNVNISLSNATALTGGLVGEFVIGTTTGSIQQSYAVTSSTSENHAAFIGKITKASGFDAEKAVMLRHLIGNIAVVNNKTEIIDTDLVKTFDETFFKNVAIAGNSAFYDKNSALYLIRGFKSAGEIISTNEFVFYAMDAEEITNWDTTYVWNTANNSLPILRMGEIEPSAPTSEYLRRTLNQVSVGDNTSFLNVFKNDIENQNIKLTTGEEVIDLTNNWNPISVVNSTIDGNNKTIKVNLANAKDNCLGLFANVENSTIKNLNIIVTGVSANADFAGAVAAKITSSDEIAKSSIENIKVTFEEFGAVNISNFGGVVGSAENTTISNVEVNGLTINSNAIIKNAGALVSVLENNAEVNNSKVNATIYATTEVAGVVANNKGTITNVTGEVEVNLVKATADAKVGGVVATNVGVVDNVNITVNINATSANTTLYVGGVVATNTGTISNIEVIGSNINVAEVDATVYVGGVVANNAGTIEGVNNAIQNVGSYYIGKNFYVGGIVSVNSGNISEVLTQSNLCGNYVSGIAVVMENTKSTIDQVAVGIYNKETKSFAENIITGDKYLTGVVFNFKEGKITNVQATSKIIGETNNTRSSLIALLFFNGTTLKNATINSSFDGYGITYRETWTDFASYSNRKEEFGINKVQTGYAGFNIYKDNAYHGKMQSVVINVANKNVSSAKAAISSMNIGGKEYNDDDANSSYIKTVNGFNDYSQFIGSFEFRYANANGFQEFFGFNGKTTRTLTFEIGSVWENNNGISLMFLNDIA